VTLFVIAHRLQTVMGVVKIKRHHYCPLACLVRTDLRKQSPDESGGKDTLYKMTQ